MPIHLSQERHSITPTVKYILLDSLVFLSATLRKRYMPIESSDGHAGIDTFQFYLIACLEQVHGPALLSHSPLDIDDLIVCTHLDLFLHAWASPVIPLADRLHSSSIPPDKQHTIMFIVQVREAHFLICLR